MVDESKEMIKSGDVFQILMTNRYVRHATLILLAFTVFYGSKIPPRICI
jgi:anthranilate synthase component I